MHQTSDSDRAEQGRHPRDPDDRVQLQGLHRTGPTPASGLRAAQRVHPAGQGRARFEDGLVVKHWDVLQDEVAAQDTVEGNPMFTNPQAGWADRQA